MSDIREAQLNKVTNYRINCRRLLLIYNSHIEGDEVKNCIINNSKYKELILANKDDITFAAVDFGEKFINKKTKDLSIFNYNGITPTIYTINSPAHWNGLMTQLGIA